MNLQGRIVRTSRALSGSVADYDHFVAQGGGAQYPDLAVLAQVILLSCPDNEYLSEDRTLKVYYKDLLERLFPDRCLGVATDVAKNIMAESRHKLLHVGDVRSARLTPPDILLDCIDRHVKDPTEALTAAHASFRREVQRRPIPAHRWFAVR